MGREEVSRPHSVKYIRQLMEWGFDKEFIARDAGINVESLMTRLRRAEERERRNGNQGTESGTSSSQPNS
jgi:IS5 family transposase